MIIKFGFIAYHPIDVLVVANDGKLYLSKKKKMMENYVITHETTTVHALLISLSHSSTNNYTHTHTLPLYLSTFLISCFLSKNGTFPQTLIISKVAHSLFWV